MWEVVQDIIQSSLEMLVWIAGFLVVFGVLERLTPCNPEQRFQPVSFLTNVTYFLLVPILTRFVRAGYMTLGVIIVFHYETVNSIQYYLRHGFGPLAQLPPWLQAAIVFILSDILLYWAHRFFHGKDLWKFHAVHHSSEHVEWHSTYRFHPINVWLSFTLVDTLMLFIGFSPESVTMMAAFNLIYSAMVHANLNWTFGPFKYLFASPVFHRWHHTTQEAGMNKNFAPTFPLLDILFGTFYMPEGELPKNYGLGGPGMPDSFLGQFIWPFRKGNG